MVRPSHADGPLLFPRMQGTNARSPPRKLSEGVIPIPLESVISPERTVQSRVNPWHPVSSSTPCVSAVTSACTSCLSSASVPQLSLPRLHPLLSAAVYFHKNRHVASSSLNMASPSSVLSTVAAFQSFAARRPLLVVRVDDTIPHSLHQYVHFCS